MTQQEINQEIEDFQRDHVKFISRRLMEEGDIEPMITVLAMNNDTQTMGIVLAPIFGDFAELPKATVIEKILPKLFEEIQEKNLKPYCFSFSSEVNIRRTRIKKEDKDKPIEDWEKLPKVEGLMISFETKDNSKTELFYMEKTGKVVNSDGELIDQIKLDPVPEFSTGEKPKAEGRFVDIFKKYL